MKTKLIPLIAMIGMGMILWQCNRDDSSSLSQKSFKETLSTNTETLNTAADAISSTEGYKMLTTSSSQVKSDDGDGDYSYYADSILLDSIKGVYEFDPSTKMFKCRNCLYRMFSRTGNSDNLVIKLPEEYVFHPWRLHYLSAEDTTMSNNFTITTTDYYYNFSHNHGWFYDYILAASFETDTSSVGSVNIQSSRKSYTDYNYSSTYTFDNDYSISVNTESGDTTSSGFSLLDGSDVLLKETLMKIRATDSTSRERIYSLQIGNIEIRRSSAVDSIEVYQDGTLQTDITAQIVDQDNDFEDHSVCKKRDIQITYADGTTANVSDLLAPSKEILSGLRDSMHNIYFAKHLIDYIAWNIYMNK